MSGLRPAHEPYVRMSHVPETSPLSALSLEILMGEVEEDDPIYEISTGEG